ncbi:class I SAM-dependent methyltransferase [Lentilactobacillus senioris]|uniref:class I SAM-dependent methyltransferase n=1 Tax=Lentilactobacillus senioris TaxID=931534 RepID=UPI003D2BB7D4
MIVLAEKQIQELFQILDDSSLFLQEKLDLSYIDSLIESLDIIQNVNDIEGIEGLSAQDFENFTSKMKSFDLQNLSAEDARKTIQMAMLKAIKQDNLQANYQITPDTIAGLFSYLISGLSKKDEEISLLDPAVGSGNLLASVVNYLREAGKVVVATGLENDDALADLASLNFELQRSEVNLYHEDTIQDVVAGNVDYVISDLPVGYYPIDDNVVQFKTKAQKGHSYLHHLLIEFGMEHVNPGGFGLFLIPSNIFKDKESKALLEWVKESVYLQGILNLPAELFQNKAAAKSILVLQKPGKNAKQVSQVMLGEFPSFKDPAAMKRFLTEIDDWELKNLDN